MGEAPRGAPRVRSRQGRKQADSRPSLRSQTVYLPLLVPLRILQNPIHPGLRRLRPTTYSPSPLSHSIMDPPPHSTLHPLFHYGLFPRRVRNKPD